MFLFAPWREQPFSQRREEKHKAQRRVTVFRAHSTDWRIMKMKKLNSLLTFLLVVLVSGGLFAQSRLSNPINENALRAHIKYLSDDQLEGRATGAPGRQLAA